MEFIWNVFPVLLLVKSYTFIEIYRLQFTLTEVYKLAHLIEIKELGRLTMNIERHVHIA